MSARQERRPVEARIRTQQVRHDIEPETAGAGQLANLYDEPVFKDWLFYLTVLAVIAGISSTVGNGNAIDLALAVVFQFVLFGVVPGGIRNNIRRRRSN